MSYTPRFKEYYDTVVAPKLQEQFGYSSKMEIPRIVKIALNQGIGQATQDVYATEMTTIAGQKAVSTMSRKDVSNFKLRKAMPIGVRVTLRRERMYEFLDRLITVALPRVRDFQGVNDKSFDGRGNYSMGVTEQIIFPEIDLDKITKIQGMDITIVTTARTDAEAFALLKEMGMPFKNQKN